MTLATRDQYRTAPRWRIKYTKTASRTAIAATWFSVFDLAGQPGAGALAIGNTSTGIVPAQGTTGYPAINTLASGGGELGEIIFRNTVASNVILFDCVFAAGAFAFNANTTLATQPSYSTRVPGGYDDNLELWYEQVTAATGNPSIAVTYNDQAGNTDGTTGTVALGTAPTAGRCIQLPFTALDTGAQLIKNITATVATVGTFNIRLMRRLWEGRVGIANGMETRAWVNASRVRFQDRPALFALVAPDSTATGLPSIAIELCDG